MISAPPSDDDRKNVTDPTKSGSLDADSVDLSFEQELEDLFAEDLGLSDDAGGNGAGAQPEMADELLAELSADGPDLDAFDDEDMAEAVIGEGVSIDDDDGALELTDLVPETASAETLEDAAGGDMDILELTPEAMMDDAAAPGESEAVVVSADEDEDGEVMLLDELLESGTEDEMEGMAEEEIVELAGALPDDLPEALDEELAVVVPDPDAALAETLAGEVPQSEQPGIEPLELEPTDFEDVLEGDEGPALAEAESLLSPEELGAEFTRELEEQLEPADGPGPEDAAEAAEAAPAKAPRDMPSAIPAAAAEALADHTLDAAEGESGDLAGPADLDDLGDLESFDMNIPEEPEAAENGQGEEIDLDGLDGLLDDLGEGGRTANAAPSTADMDANGTDLGELADIEALLEETEAELAAADAELAAGEELDDLSELSVDDLDALLEGVRDDELETPMTATADAATEADPDAAENADGNAPQAEATAGPDEEDLLRDDLLDGENLFAGGDLTAFDGVELPDIDVSEFDADLPGEGRDEVARLLDDINPDEFADAPQAEPEGAPQPLAGAPLADVEPPAATAAPGSCEDFKARLMALEGRAADMDAALGRLALLEDKVQAMDEALDAARSGLRGLEDRSVELEAALEGFDERFKDEIEQAVPLEAARIIREEIAALARELDG